MGDIINFKHVLGSLMYSFIGFFILLFCFWLIERLTPDKLWKEIIEKQNIALAIMAAAFMIAIAIIIHSAIHE